MMATSSMAPSLTQAPLGLGAGLNGTAEADFQDSGFNSVQEDLPDGGVLITLSAEIMDESPEAGEKGEFSENMAESMDESELQQIAGDLMELVDMDIGARKDWVDAFVKGMEVLGMKYDERTEPWAGACGVYSTILTEAAIRFQADTILETFPAMGPVKAEIIGRETPEKKESAERVVEDMNFQLTEVMQEYRPEHEKMLYSLGLAGSSFKKVYYDEAKGRQVSYFIPSEDLIIPFGSTNVAEAERATHIMRKTPNEIKRLQANGFYRDVDLGEPQNLQTDIEKKKAEEQGFTLTDDDRYQIREIHVEWVMPKDKFADNKGSDQEDWLARPYVVTIDTGTMKVLAIRRNWRPEDKLKQKRQHFVQYTYIPGFGPYGIGLINLIGGYARAGTSLIRQLVDAGTLSNLPGGLKSRGMRIKGDDTPIAPGEFRDVDVPSGTLQQNVMTLPYKEPSQVLMALLQQITEEGRRLGSIADMKTSDMSAQAPVGTTLAILERQLKTMSAVQARVHYSMKQEFKLLKEIIRDYTPKEYAFDPEEGDRKAKQSDYDAVDVIPVSDPNSATMAQRIMQYQAVIQLAQGAPHIYNLPVLHRQMIEVLGVKNAEKLIPIEDDMQPVDPVSENMALLTGKPTKAFITQDHDAHIAVHSSMMQDPVLMAQLGQSPLTQQIQGAMMSHIAEHLAFQYRSQMQTALGVTLPAPDTKMSPVIEAQVSKLVAQAAVQLLQQHQAMAAQQKAQQVAQDPIIQMQQQELQIKAKEAETKAKKVDGELALKGQELLLKAKQQAPQETPEMVMQRHQQELAAQQAAMEQQQQRHAAELQQAQEAHAAQLAQQQEQHRTGLTHQVQKQNMDHTIAAATHTQKQRHADEAHQAKIEQMKAAAVAAAKAKPAPKKGE